MLKNLTPLTFSKQQSKVSYLISSFLAKHNFFFLLKKTILKKEYCIVSSYRKNFELISFSIKGITKCRKVIILFVICMLLAVHFFYYNPPPPEERSWGGGVIKESHCLSVCAKLGPSPYFS